jgi:hypothetical protein
MVVEDSPALVWFTDWSVWESGEHMPLVTALRSSFGSTQNLPETPGSIVEPDESDAGISLFLVAALFGWDCWLVTSAKPHSVMFCSHDEFVDVYLPPGRELTNIERFHVELQAITQT